MCLKKEVITIKKKGNMVEELFGDHEWADEVLIAHADMEEAKFASGRGNDSDYVGSEDNVETQNEDCVSDEIIRPRGYNMEF